jgi:hypothetical protein
MVCSSSTQYLAEHCVAADSDNCIEKSLSLTVNRIRYINQEVIEENSTRSNAAHRGMISDNMGGECKEEHAEIRAVLDRL